MSSFFRILFWIFPCILFFGVPASFAQRPSVSDMLKLLNEENGVEKLIKVLPKRDLGGRTLVDVREEEMHLLYMIADTNIKNSNYDILIAERSYRGSFGKFVPKLTLKAEQKKAANLQSFFPDATSDNTDYFIYNQTETNQFTGSISKLTEFGTLFSLTFRATDTNPANIQFQEKGYGKTIIEEQTPNQQTEWILSANIPLLKNAGNSNRTEADIAKINLESSLLQKRETLKNTLGTSINAFWFLASQSETIFLQQRNLEVSGENLKKAQLNADLGGIAGVEVRQMETLYKIEEQKLENERLSLINVEQQIKDALGVKTLPLGIYPIFSREFPPLDFSQEAQEQWVQDILDNSESYRLKRAEYSKLKLNEEKFSNASDPKLDLDLSYTIQGHGESFSDTTDGYSQSDINEYSVALTYEVPLGENGDDAELQKTRIRIQKSREELKSLRSNIELDAEKRFRELQLEFLRYENAERSKKVQKELYDQEQERYNLGGSSLLNLEQAKLNYFEAEKNLIALYSSFRVKYGELAILAGRHPLIPVGEELTPNPVIE